MGRAFRSVARVGTRIGLVSLDQAVSSLSNLLISVIAAHKLSPTEFGAFGVVFATYMLLVFLIRAATGEVLLLAGLKRATEEASPNLLISFIAGLFAGFLLAGVAIAMGGAVGAGLLPLAVGLAGLTLQDCIRYVGFATQRVRLALITDLLWLLFILVFFLPNLTSQMTVERVTSIWVAAGFLASILTVLIARFEFPALSSVRAGIRNRRHLMISLVADRGLVSGAQQSVIYVVAIMIGLEGNAAYRAAQIIMGPVNILIAGIMTATVPHLVRIWNERPSELMRRAVLIGAGASVIFLIVCQIIAEIPDRIGQYLVGGSWDLGKPLLPLMALFIAIQGGNFAALGALRAMNAAGSALAVRTLIAPMTVAAIVVAALTGNILTVMWTQVVCAAVASLLWWIMAVRIQRRRLADAEGPNAERER